MIKQCLFWNLFGGMYHVEVGREGIEPSWVAPGDFKSHSGVNWLIRPLHTIAVV